MPADFFSIRLGTLAYVPRQMPSVFVSFFGIYVARLRLAQDSVAVILNREEADSES